MRSVNRVFLMGHLGQNPELQRSKAGKSYTRLSLATDRFKKGASAEEESEKPSTDWHSVFVWGEQAEHCVQYLRRGALVYVEGALTYWQVAQPTDVETAKNYKNAIQAERVNFITYGKRTETSEDAANVDNPAPARNHNAVAHPLM